MIKLGDAGVSKLYLGDTEIKMAYVGDIVVYPPKAIETEIVLPDGYKRVEYVEVGQNDRVTLHSFYTNNQVLIDVQPLSYVKDSYLFYSTSTVSYAKKYFYIKRERSIYSQIIITGIIDNSNIPIEDNVRIKIDINLPKNVVKVGENSFKSSDYVYMNCGQFGIGNDGSSSSLVTAPARWYSVKMYDGENLKYDYVPCINQSGYVGMYDIITSSFRRGSNGGGLLAGPTV